MLKIVQRVKKVLYHSTLNGYIHASVYNGGVEVVSEVKLIINLAFKFLHISSSLLISLNLEN